MLHTHTHTHTDKCTQQYVITGGNVEYTKKDETVVAPGGQIVIGFTDLPSRMPQQSSNMYSNNISKVGCALEAATA